MSRILRGRLTYALTLAALTGTVALTPLAEVVTGSTGQAAGSEAGTVPEVLTGDFWLEHHRERLMPYWDMPEALGTPMGNFPSFRDGLGMPVASSVENPRAANRGLATLARQVYGYSLAFMLTGEEHYLTYAKAGLAWIEQKARDPLHGGWFGELDAEGEPVNVVQNAMVEPRREGRKDVFDLASLGLAYGMYFNVTRDADAEAGLLAVRDLWFDKYYDAAGNRVRDSFTFDLAQPVDTNNNGDDITNLLVPGTALFLPNAAVLSDPARTEQFLQDLRNVTQSMIDRHRSAAQKYPWWFWGVTGRIGSYNSVQTNFGHNIKAYEMIYNANRRFPDRPWETLGPDRDTLLSMAWDPTAGRWHEELRASSVLPDSGWWGHAEADQTLAALDLGNGFSHAGWLAASAQSYLDTFLDEVHPYETFTRVLRDGTVIDGRKTFFGKNMLHAHEHALIMYLHGRAMEGEPATLHYAFPKSRTLTLVAKPYWFDAAGQSRTVLGDISVLPRHRLVEVEFTGIEAVPPPPYPAPPDTTAPSAGVTVTGSSHPDGGYVGEATLAFAASDDLAGVKEIHATVVESDASVPDRAYVDPGADWSLTLGEGSYKVKYRAVDVLGNTGEWRTVHVVVVGA